MKKENSNLFVTAGIFFAIALSILAFSRSGQVVQTITTPEGEKIAVGGTSPEVSSPYFKINDFATWYQALPIGNKTSSTICSILSPVATSTLDFASVSITSGAITGDIKVYKSATVSATTTLLFGGTVTTGAQSVLYSTTTTSDYVIAPSQYIVFDSNNSTAPAGKCQAKFIQVN